MVHLPVRKCFYVAKVGVVLLLVVSVLAMVERWRGGKRTARAQDLDPDEEDYERQVLADEARIVPGLGEGGVAAQLTGRDKQLGEESEKKLAINVYLSDRVAYNRSLNDKYESEIGADEAKFVPGLGEMGMGAFLSGELLRLSEESIKENALNVFLSDMIAYNRSVGDHRNPACKRVVYDAELPSVSVIIIFHNEPYSVVVRTVWSVINSARRDQPWYQKANFVDRETGRTMTLGYPGQDPNSPFVYLKEIILVDDNSTLPELKGKLSHYIRTRMPPNLIRILRLPERRGVTQARFAGSKAAVGDVLIFLDSHCEANPDWLRPLLQRINDKRSAVLTPIIDVIANKNLKYIGAPQNTKMFLRRRRGLIYARQVGCNTSVAEVSVFLDAHCEVVPDWLRPLLQRIKENRTAVVTPNIETIDQKTFKYEWQGDTDDDQVIESVGLTRARLAGARYATADALVFLDAHCEGQPDWLRPLLQRMKDAPNAVVMPIIDVIDSSNMYYSVADPTFFQGLMLARIRGARSARGNVLIFLDAHCESGADWLRPLIQRIRDKRDAVVTPLIDVIDQSTFELEAAEEFQVGGFNFMGHFTWIDVPDREKKRRGSDIGATWSPTMAGGLFAINREYYWELGAYDEQMAGWGGENLEMSFRIWQCGGTLETIPCSRVGHVFRAFHPYGMPAHTDTHGINTARMAEVWMDDYKELFYLHRPDLRKSPKIGDVTHRKILREKLQCKNFEWYLQHIYKEKFVPVRDAFGYGRFRNLASGLCLDTLQREADAAPLGVYPCHPTLQGTQYLSLALDGVLRDEERCVQLQYNRETDADSNEGRKLLLVSCSKKLKEQKWRYTTSKQLIHEATGLCLDSGFEAGADVVATKCRSGATTQRWEVDYNEHNGFRLSEDREPSEAELTLQKLRGQRRISRSLMSIESENSTNANKMRRHSHKKKKHKKSRKHSKAKRTRSKTKNKFILQLVRTLMNNSEDHLEVDIHCKHRQLYPNNSFVRDLVTILNERNIKVINNGRVFERNRVTELARDPTTMRQTEAKVLKKLELEQSSPMQENPPPQPQPIPPQQQVARASPDQPINRWVSKKRRLKIAPVPISNTQGFNAVNNVEQVVFNQQDANDALADKKIIIEDFVEVKPPVVTPEPYVNQRAQNKRPAKKRKRKQKHHNAREQTTAKPEEKPTLRAKQIVSIQHEYDEDAGSRPDSAQRQASAEKVTSVTSQEATKRSQGEIVVNVEDKESDQDDEGHDSEWVMGTESPAGELPRNKSVTSYRRANVQLVDMADNSDATESSAYQASPDELPQNTSLHFRHSKAPAPLKVVMKSNLTFNLGDEFFKWRATDDVNDLLGELAIPSNASRAAPPLHAWVKPPPPAAPQSFRSDALLTAHGALPLSAKEGGASLQAADDSQSSSSESEQRRDRNNGGGGFY